MDKNALFAVLLMGLFLITGLAAAPELTEEFSPGKHYQAIEPAQPVQTADKIEVLEVFGYACPHCYDFEPYLERWISQKAPDVEVRRMPAVFRQNWLAHAKAFYTAEALGVVGKITGPLFKAMHVDKRKLDDEPSLAEFFAEQGLSKEKFSKTFNSFAVDTKVRQAQHLVRAYGIQGVPTIVVNGKYQTSGSLAGDYDTVLKVIAYLVDKERAEAATRK